MVSRYAVPFVMAALIHCGQVADEGQPASASDASAAADAKTLSAPDAPPPDAVDVVVTDAGASFDASPPPVSCAADASVCQNLPASVCADDKSLLYFSSGACVSGRCVWKTKVIPCGAQSSCVQGGCTPPTTR